MKRIGLLGVGGHSRACHIPALELLLARDAGRFAVAAVCDLNREAAAKVAGRFDAVAYDDAMAMLAPADLDGLICVTPIAVTQAVIEQLAPVGVPLLIEKPLGPSLESARAIRDVVEKHDTRAMVSTNRRFSPVVRRGVELLAGRAVAHVRVTFSRVARAEAGFIQETVFHPIDTLRHILGDVAEHRITPIPGATAGEWAHIALRFNSGATGGIDVAPTAGRWIECIELVGEGFTLRLDLPDTVTLWEAGKQVACETPTKGQPGCVSDGTVNETDAFLAALEGAGPFYPTPRQVLGTMEICCTSIEAG